MSRYQGPQLFSQHAKRRLLKRFGPFVDIKEQYLFMNKLSEAIYECDFVRIKFDDKCDKVVLDIEYKYDEVVKKYTIKVVVNFRGIKPQIVTLYED